MKSEKYWTDRYLLNQTGWDIGYASTPLVEYMQQIEDKDLSILIPGAGYGHEAIHLHEQGFTNISVCDISSIPLQNISKKAPSFPKGNLLEKDFFSLDKTYDLILEQTFFCALHPDQRPAYVSKMRDLLKDNGKLAGLLFAIEFNKDGPPWGGHKENYMEIFKHHFNILEMEISYNSIPSRSGNEYFFRMKRKER